MGFMKVNTSEENVKDYTGDGGKYLNKSGMYEVILKAVIVDRTEKGSEFINLWIEHEGQEQPIFQAMRLTNNDGTPNLGQQLFTKLCVICGATDGQEIPDPVSRKIPIGAEGTEKDCDVLEIFDNIPIHMRLQMEYGMGNGKIQQRKNVRNVFRCEDKASASEIVNGTEIGKQYAIEMEYADKVTYKDGLTEEDIKEWIKNRKSGKAEESKKDAKPAGGFGIRFGGKK